MASTQERLKLKRPPCESWSIREQLCLASSVLKSGDQNWVCVSRALKSFIEKDSQRPPDWFSQKSCAVQYSLLLENADTPKRKKRETSETVGESIVRRLTQERMTELGQILASQREEYQQLKAELNLLKSSNPSEEKLQKIWHAIELEEREQEQKGKAHTAWLAKRQKQEGQTPQTLSFNIQRKSESSEGHDSLDPSTDEEEKKNKGGRSPLLTSLLKSPSPTTQIQSQTSSAQVTSPTIASLLGSSPKIPNPQLTQTVSPQLHQLVSTAIANATPERPSVGAPTLSMLLELPANLQRNTLPNLQPHTSTTTNLPQPNIDLQVMQIENQRGNIQIMEPAMAPRNMSTSEIINHINEVIPKDIMADVIDKDEINEIIGDIEELIKGEIPDTTQVLDPATTGVIENLNLPQPQLVSEKQEIRNVPETVLSDSPESEIAIEEIDSSTSNIAEIIGTVAIEPKIIPQKLKAVEGKSGDDNKLETSLKSSEESKKEKAQDSPKDSEQMMNSEAVNKIKFLEEKEETVEIKEDAKKFTKEDAKKSVKEETKKLVKEEVKKCPKEESKVSTKSDVKKEIKEELKKDTAENAEKEVKENLKKDTKDNPEKDTNKETKEVPVLKDLSDGESQSTSEKQNLNENMVNKDIKGDINKSDMDQLELNLAQITGDQEASSAEVLSVSSNDSISNEDTEKSQDISLILEDEEILPSHQEKKKEDEVIMIEPAADVVESTASSKEEIIIIKEDSGENDKKDASEKNKEQSKEDADVEMENFKKEDTKDSSDGTSNTEVLEDDLKDEEGEGEEEEEEEEEEQEEEESQGKASASKKNEDRLKESEKFSEDENLNKEKNIKLKTVKEEDECQEETSTDETIKNEKDIKEEKEDKKNIDLDISVKKEGDFSENVGELDEEESTLSKLSGGRAMKTYSKRQTIVVDSEPEMEGSGEGADYRAWKKAVMLVYNRLATHKYASAFLRPITEDQAPGYHSIIFRPMDLSTIKKNIDNGTIRSTRHFQRDVMLMFQNAIMYNKHDTFVYKMAITMQEECLQHMQILVQVTGEVSFRRETRTAASSSSEASEPAIKKKRSHITPSPHDTDSPRGKKRRKSEND